jgi:hypothetical protein
MKESEPASGNGDVSPLPWQQAAVVMYATGSTGREIAKVFDRTPQCVSGLCQQKWFQSAVAEILSEHSLSVLELFRAETVHCLQVLIEIMDDPNTPAGVRVLCARDILDRSLGKPVQHIQNESVLHSEDPVAECQRLEAEINRLRDEQQNYGA